MARMLIVSNRLPITVRHNDGELVVERSSGGLATGLKSVHETGGGQWIGWHGLAGNLSDAEQATLGARFETLRVVPITLSADELERYYEGYCNGVLWPLFHSFPSQLPLEGGDYALYERVNETFADAVVKHWQPGDLIWIHDYQLMRLPALLRLRLPSATIGFFLHIPFPPADTFRTLPAREALLEGLLAADLVGFHTAAYVRNFASSVLHVLGAGIDVNSIVYQGRVSNVGVFPMGVDAKAYQTLAESNAVKDLVSTFTSAPLKLVMGIDRLDYTKGIPRRLLAFEKLLEAHPELRGAVRLVQVAVPSRSGVHAYAEFRAQVDGLIGRINGRFGTPNWSPVHYVYRNLSEQEVAALYRATDVMLVTAIRDGMNLVAKEFVAARSDDDGVLVLSEFTGAAAELAEAVRVNPYDLEGSARAIYTALTMAEPERRTRMESLRKRVFAYDVHRWASTFVSTLEECAKHADHRPLAFSSAAQLRGATATMRDAAQLMVLVDYDGTLVPLASAPQLAPPDRALVSLLERLAARPNTSVHVVSGRGRDVLDAWLGALSISLHAEHGHWSRPAGADWSSAGPVSDLWRARALEIFEDFVARTPGALVEQKRSGLAFHYRMADAEYGLAQANELKAHLSSVLSNAPVEVVSGKMVVELRPHGANKGRIVRDVMAQAPSATIAAFGDDLTDEDMFRALPPSGISVHVGASPSAATFRVPSSHEVRGLLSALLKSPSTRGTAD